MNDQPPRAARRRLIDELEALCATLGSKQPDAPAVMPPAAADARPLLDLGAIFDDDGLFDDGDAPLLFWPLQEPVGKRGNPPVPATDRAALIEQIVDRLLPDLERQLRDQLRGLDLESLRQLLR